MQITTTRFGNIDIDDSKIYHFPEGIIGFSEKKNFTVLDHRENSPFKWLQSVDDGALAFIIIDPYLFMQKYDPHPMKADLEAIQLQAIEGAQIYTIVVVPQDPQKMSANLLGPLIINTQARIGKQVILSNDAYTTCHYIVDELMKIVN